MKKESGSSIGAILLRKLIIQEELMRSNTKIIKTIITEIYRETKKTIIFFVFTTRPTIKQYVIRETKKNSIQNQNPIYHFEIINFQKILVRRPSASILKTESYGIYIDETASVGHCSNYDKVRTFAFRNFAKKKFHRHCVPKQLFVETFERRFCYNIKLVNLIKRVIRKIIIILSQNVFCNLLFM